MILHVIFSWWFLLTKKNIVTFFSFHLNWPKKPSSPPSSCCCCCSINMKIFIWTIACLLPVIVSHSFAIATSHPIALIEYLETNQQPSIDEKWKHIEFILWRDVAFDVDVAAAVLCTISNKHLTTNNNSHTNTRKKNCFETLKQYQRGYWNAAAIIAACLSTRNITRRCRCFLSSRRWYGQPNTWWINQRVQWTGKHY